MNRPRGLCWGCYYTPGVKGQYPSTSKYAPGREPSDEEVDAMVADLDAPPVIPPEARPVFEAFDLGRTRTRSEYLLTPDTAPDVIAAGQRAEVAEYLAAHPGDSDEQVSAALVLPVWSVQLRRAELRGEPAPYTSAMRKHA